ncbi:MAG: hypothetical protein U1F68_15380 [Gammaproteobacteria bacterium]
MNAARQQLQAERGALNECRVRLQERERLLQMLQQQMEHNKACKERQRLQAQVEDLRRQLNDAQWQIVQVWARKLRDERQQQCLVEEQLAEKNNTNAPSIRRNCWVCSMRRKNQRLRTARPSTYGGRRILYVGDLPRLQAYFRGAGGAS